MSKAASRVRAYRFGHLAETLATVVLRLKGYGILARRYRTKVGEIDVIAKRGRVLAMVEVKARTGGGVDAADSLGREQRRRIERAAELWRAAHPGSENYDIRFDLMIIGPHFLPRHLPGAWIAGD